MTICGVDVPLPLAPGAFRRHRISFVHQHLGLIPALTVLENMLIGRLAASRSIAIDWGRERRKAAARFEAYGLSIDPNRKLSDLSPVQRALLAIVRATDEMESGDGSGNGLLVLDEPTPFLPRRDVDQLFDVVRSVVRTGASVIFVSHDVDEVLEITDRATVLRDGRVVARLVTARSSKHQFIEAIVGRRLSMTERMARPPLSAATQVEVAGLSGGAIASLDFSAGEGEIVGLTGLIGSGYDEIPYLLYGAKPATGDLRLGGKVISLAGLTPRAAIDSGIVLIPADRPGAGAIGALSVADNVTMPVIGVGIRRWLLNRTDLLRSSRRPGRTVRRSPARSAPRDVQPQRRQSAKSVAGEMVSALAAIGSAGRAHPGRRHRRAADRIPPYRQCGSNRRHGPLREFGLWAVGGDLQSRSDFLRRANCRCARRFGDHQGGDRRTQPGRARGMRRARDDR